MATDDDIKHSVFVRVNSVYNDKNSLLPWYMCKMRWT
jgi:hypothetical protein